MNLMKTKLGLLVSIAIALLLAGYLGSVYELLAFPVAPPRWTPQTYRPLVKGHPRLGRALVRLTPISWSATPITSGTFYSWKLVRTTDHRLRARHILNFPETALLSQ